jgi:hypothetical protein
VKEADMAMIDVDTAELERLLEPETERTFDEVDPGPQPFSASKALSGRWAAFLTVAWVTIFSVGVALEPSAADEDALPLVGAVLVTGLMVGWLVMATGFVRRRRSGAMGSLVAAGFLVAMTVGCPLSGHHAGIGAWWWFEMAGSLALVGASGAALRST